MAGEDAGSSQARRLRDLLEAKQEHDAAIARIDECVAEGLLSATEAADQRGLACRALMASKANAGVAAEGRDFDRGTEEAEPKRGRGRQVGSKNTPRTGLDDLQDKTLCRVCKDLGLEWIDRAQAISAIHLLSGSSAKTPKTNLDGLTEDTLALICTDRTLASIGNRADLISRIMGGKEKDRGKEPSCEEEKPANKPAQQKQQAKKVKTAKKKAGGHGDFVAEGDKPKRAATPYNLFMKEEVARIKKGDPSLAHKEAFKQAAANWGTAKQQTLGEEAEHGDEDDEAEDNKPGSPCGSLHPSEEEDSSDNWFDEELDDAWDSCDDDLKRVTTKDTAGLVFPVDHVARMSALEMPAASDPAIFLTAVLEYLAAEIVELSGKRARTAIGEGEDDEGGEGDEEDDDAPSDHRLVKPSPKIRCGLIKASVGNDQELYQLFAETKFLLWSKGAHVDGVWERPKSFGHGSLCKRVDAVLHQCYPRRMHMTKSSKTMLVMMLVNVVHRVDERVKPQIGSSAQKVTVKDMKGAVELVLGFPGELSKLAVKEGAKALRNRDVSEAMDAVETLSQRVRQLQWPSDVVARLVKAVSGHLNEEDDDTQKLPPNQKLLDKAFEVLAKGAGYPSSTDRGNKRVQLVENGVIELVISTLDRYFEDTTWSTSGVAPLNNCFGIIASLTYRSEHADNRALVSEAGGIERLLRFIEAHTDASSGQRCALAECLLARALEALSSLSQSSECATKVKTSRGIDIVMQVLASRVQNKGVYEYACKVVASLASHHVLRGSLIEAGAISCVVGSINRFPNSSIRRAALDALGELVQDSCSEPSIIDRIIEAGGIKEVYSALRGQHMQASDVESASKLIRHLANTEENRLNLAKEGFIELLTCSLGKSSADTCNALEQIGSSSSDLQERMRGAGAVECLNTILADEKLTCKTKEAATKLLTLLTSRKRRHEEVDLTDSHEVLDLTDSPPEKDARKRNAAGGVKASKKKKEGGAGGEGSGGVRERKAEAIAAAILHTSSGAGGGGSAGAKEKKAHVRHYCFTSCYAGARPKCICGRARFPPGYVIVGPGLPDEQGIPHQVAEAFELNELKLGLAPTPHMRKLLMKSNQGKQLLQDIDTYGKYGKFHDYSVRSP